MSVRTDTVNLIVNVNGNQSRAELNKLRQSAADIRFEMQNLTKGTAEYRAKAKELSEVNARMTELKRTIGITGLNQKELTAELSRLKSLRGSVEPFSKEFKELSQQIKAVENRLYDVRNGVQGFSSFFSKIKDEVKQFGALAAGYLGFQFISSQFQNIISGSGKLSDSLADLRRVAGLTATEALNLNTQLSKIDTRTSVAGLRDIAVIAGKLGVAKEDIFGFTKAVDELVVALGDELGDAGQITDQLGKILNVFDGKVTGDNISRLGNAFVELANTGAASGGFIADFDQRLSGIAKSANIGLGALSGLGAGLEELGGRVESSATAIQKLISNIAADLPGAAKISGLSTDAFTKLFNENATEALLKYSEGLVKNKNSFAEVTASLKDAGEEGARTIETISKLGSNADYLRGRIDLGTKSLQDNTAITEAFRLKNETFGATLDKLGKEFNSLVNSPAVTGFLQSAVEGAVKFIDVLKALPKWFADNRAGLAILALAYVVYNAEQIKSRILALLNTQVLTGQTAAVRLLAAAKFLLTGNITKAKEAWQAFTAIINKNPLGILLTAIGLLTIAITTLTGKYKTLSAEQRVAQEVQKKYVELYQDDITRIEQLKKVLTDETSSLTQKKNAYQELIKIHPEFANTLKLDAEGHLQGAQAIDDFIAALKRKGQAEAREAVASEKRRSALQLEIDLTNEFNKKGYSGQSQLNVLSASIANSEVSIEDKRKGLNANQRKAIRERGLQIEKEIQDALNENPENAYNVLDNYYKKFKLNIDDVNGNVGTIARKLKGLRDELKVLDGQSEKDLRKNLSTPIQPENAITKAANDVAALRAQIKSLDEAFEKLNVNDKKAIDENRKRREELQKQLDALEGKKSGSNTGGDGEYKRLKAEAEKFYADLRKLKERAEAGDANHEEVVKLSQKYAELLAEAEKYYNKHITNTKVFNEETNAIETIALHDLTELKKKQSETIAEQNYTGALNVQRQFTEQLKEQYAQQYADGTISKQQYDDAIKASDDNLLINLIANAELWAARSKKAAADVVVFKGQQNDKELEAAIKLRDAKIQFAAEEEEAKYKLAVVTSQPGSKANFDARKAELKFEEQLSVNAEIEKWQKVGIAVDEGSQQIQLIRAEYREKEKQLDREEVNAKIETIQQWANFTANVIQNLDQIISNRENAALARDKAANEKKKSNFKKQLDAKLISQAQYDKEIQRLDKEQEQKEKEAKRRQAKREKAIQIFLAVINTAGAVAKALNNPYPLNIILAAIAAAAGAVQIAAISSQPIPEAAKGKFLDKGAKHNEKEGGIPIMAERGEAILNARAMDDPRKYTITGTPRQIASKINSQSGGVSWAPGAVVSMTPWLQRRPAQINASLPGIMARGGIVVPFDPTTATEPDGARAAVNRNGGNTGKIEALMEEMVAEQRRNTDEIRTMKREIKANVSIKDLEYQKDLYDKAKAASGL